MASENKKESSKKKKNKETENKESGREDTSAGTSNSKGNKEFSVADDVKIISGFVVMILLLFSNFHVVGVVGDYISYFMFGMFGLFAYIIPVLIFIAVCFYIANMENDMARRKFTASVVLYVMLSSLLQLIYSSADSNFKLGGIYTECAKVRNGGGLLGGIFAALLHGMIGTFGTYIVIFAVAIVCIVIISEKSFVGSVKKHSKNAYHSAKEDMRRRKDENDRKVKPNNRQRAVKREKKERDRRLVRAKRPARGVNLSRVTDGNDMDADVHELVNNGALYRGPIEVEDEEKSGNCYVEEQNTYNTYENDNITESKSEENYAESEGKTAYDADLEMKFDEQYEVETEYIVPDIEKIWSNSDYYRESQNISQSEADGIYSNAYSCVSQNEMRDTINDALEKQSDEDVRNGEFKPKEKIEVSKAAKEIMKRDAFFGSNMSGNENIDRNAKRQAKEIPNDIPAPDVSSNIKDRQELVKPTAQALKTKKYVMPPIELLRKGNGFRNSSGGKNGKISETALKLQQTLDAFGVKATVINESRGPSVTRYELQPETGTKVSKITALTDDIKLNLAAADIRIEAPIPGKAAVGIEVPNAKRESVFLRDLIESTELSKHPSKLAFAAGMDIAGKVIVADIAKMPHMLIAGTTGSGKSVFTNSIIMSILYRAKPSEVKLIIVDPKVVEFGVYNGIPHLLTPVVTDPRKAAGALNWAVTEMSERYKLFAEYNVRDLKGYNDKIKQMNYKDGDRILEAKPQIVIIIDELADLMMVAAKEVEGTICRLAQLARAAGIHLIIATQRPSVDVVTGLIKANIPSRVALLVSSGTDSRTIIDCNGGEKLLGNGDMLFYPSGYIKPVRLQGAFVSDEEVQKVVNFLIENNQAATYNESIANADLQSASGEGQSTGDGDDKDILFEQAARFVIEKEKGSTSMLQRMFKIGFNRAARIIDQLEKAGVVGSDEGTKPRKVLMTLEEFEQML